MRTALRWSRLTAAALCALGGAAVLGSLLVTSGRPTVVALQAFSVVTLPVFAIGSCSPWCRSVV